MKRILLAAAALIGSVAAYLGIVGCEISVPFRGPGYDRKKGVSLEGVGDTVVLGLTHATLDGSARGPFDDHTQRVMKDLPMNEGLIGFAVRFEALGDKVWTMSVWRDEASLDAFVDSRVHRAAIAAGASAMKDARFMRLHWPTAAVPPTWDQAKAIIARPSAALAAPATPAAGAAPESEIQSGSY